MLGSSRFNRRLHAISEELWRTLFLALAEIHQQNNHELEFAVDSFPVAVCQNIRIWRSKIYKGEDFRGYIASKKQILSVTRKKIETTFSGITQRFPKTIHAVLAKGFEIKIIAFIIPHSMNLLFQAG